LAPEAAHGGFSGADVAEVEEAADLDPTETRLIREQMGALTQEMRLVTEAFRSAGVAARLRAIVEANSVARQLGSDEASAVTGSETEADKHQAAFGLDSLGATFNDVMFEKQNGHPGHRPKEITDYLQYASSRFVARRQEGELPLGQVPQPGMA